MSIAEVGFTITTIMITVTFTYLLLSMRSILSLLKIMIDANTERHESVNARITSLGTLITNAFPPPNMDDYDFAPPKEREYISLTIPGYDDLILEKNKKSSNNRSNREENKLPFYKKVLTCIPSEWNESLDRIIDNFSDNFVEKPVRYKIQSAIYLLKRKGFVVGSSGENWRRIK